MRPRSWQEALTQTQECLVGVSDKKVAARQLDFLLRDLDGCTEPLLVALAAALHIPWKRHPCYDSKWRLLALIRSRLWEQWTARSVAARDTA